MTIKSSDAIALYAAEKNAVVGIIAAEDFDLIKGESYLRAYKWNTKRENHYFCGVCGIYTHHTLADKPARIGINLACCNSVNVAKLNPLFGDGASLPLVE